MYQFGNFFHTRHTKSFIIGAGEIEHSHTNKKQDTKTKGGIIIPDTAKEKPQQGEVLAVGEGRWDDEGENRIPVDISVGDVVVYSKYGGTEINIEGADLLILSARAVLAIVK